MHLPRRLDPAHQRAPVIQLALDPNSRRASRLGPNHHLWRNGRLWWIAYTLLHDGWRQERIRHSLGTSDVEEARRRRDRILVHWQEAASPTVFHPLPTRGDADEDRDVGGAQDQAGPFEASA